MHGGPPPVWNRRYERSTQDDNLAIRLAKMAVNVCTKVLGGEAPFKSHTPDTVIATGRTHLEQLMYASPRPDEATEEVIQGVISDATPPPNPDSN